MHDKLIHSINYECLCFCASACPPVCVNVKGTNTWTVYSESWYANDAATYYKGEQETPMDTALCKQTELQVPEGRETAVDLCCTDTTYIEVD